MAGEAPERPTEIPQHPRLEIVDIVQRLARFERLIDLDELSDAEGLWAPPLQLGVSLVGVEGDLVKALVSLRGMKRPEEPSAPKLAFTFELIYDIAFRRLQGEGEGPNGEQPVSVEALLERVVPIVVWPFLRAEVASATARLGLPSLLLPLVAVGEAVQVEISTKPPSAGGHGGAKAG